MCVGIYTVNRIYAFMHILRIFLDIYRYVRDSLLVSDVKIAFVYRPVFMILEFHMELKSSIKSSGNIKKEYDRNDTKTHYY